MNANSLVCSSAISGTGMRGPAFAAGGLVAIHLVALAVDKFPMIQAPHAWRGVGVAVVFLAAAWVARNMLLRSPRPS